MSHKKNFRVSLAMKQSGNEYTFLPFAQNVGIRIFPRIVLKSGPDTKTEKEISGHDP